MSQNGSSPDIPPFSEETLGTIKGTEPTKPNPHYRGEAANADEMNAIPDPIGGDFCDRTDTSSEWKYDWIEGRNIWYDTNFPIGTIPHTIPNTGKIVAEGEGIGSAAGLSSGTFFLKKETIYFTLTDFNSFVLPRIYDFFDLHGISSAPDVIVYTVNIKTPLSTSSGVVSFLDNNTRRFHLSESRKSIKMYIYTSSFSRSEIRTLRFYFNDLNILTLKYIDYMKASGSSDYLSLITNNGITSFNSSGAIDLKLDGYYYEEI
jgi:hypothetical protein